MISPENVAENIVSRVISLNGENIPLFDIRKPYNIGEDPSSLRIAFPYDITSPLQVVEGGGIENVASPGNGPCIITTTTVYKTHNHAGGHADGPFHLGEEFENVVFDDSQYTGSATVINLSPYFTEGGKRTITKDMLESIASKPGSNFSKSRRLLIKTYDAYPEKFDNNAAHFDREGADFIAGLDNLVLVGIDTPSIDHYEADIHEGAHGALIGNGIAVLEGLRFYNPLFDNSSIVGVIQTIFNPYQIGKDAKGALVNFYVPNITFLG